jgi:hypothetical protein
VDPYQALKTTDTWQPAKLQVEERDDLAAQVEQLTQRVADLTAWVTGFADGMDSRIAALERRYVRLEEHVSVKREAIDGVGTVEISGHES